MAEINVKWPGQYVAEDTTHRLVTDEQILKWNENFDRFKYLSDSLGVTASLDKALDPSEETPEGSENTVSLNIRIIQAPDPNETRPITACILDIDYTGIRIHDAYTFYSYIQNAHSINIIYNKKDHKYNNKADITIDLDEYCKNATEITDWNNAKETGVYYSSYSATYNDGAYTDNPDMHMPLPTNYNDIFNLMKVFYNSDNVSYIGKVINSGKKIIQELELNASINDTIKYYEEDFMKSLGCKFIRYGFYTYNYKIVWSNWYIINYDLGTVDSNITSEFVVPPVS